MTPARHIVAWGGALSPKPEDNTPLTGYVIRLARRKRPRVCITGPGSDEVIQAYKYFTFFSQFDCRLSHLSLFKQPTRDLDDFLLEKDVIFVGGGNTRTMLAIWREYGLNRILRTGSAISVMVVRSLDGTSISWCPSRFYLKL